MRFGSACHGIFSASRDKSVKMWRRGNAHPLRDFLGHDLVVTALDLNGGKYSCVCTLSKLYVWISIQNDQKI